MEDGLGRIPSDHNPKETKTKLNPKGLKLSLNSSSQVNDDASSTNNFTPNCFNQIRSLQATPINSNKALILSHMDNSFESSEGEGEEAREKGRKAGKKERECRVDLGTILQTPTAAVVSPVSNAAPQK